MYFDKKEVEKRLKEAKIDDEGRGFQFGWGGFRVEDKYPDWAYCKLADIIVPDPQLVAGLKPELVVLGEGLALEQNRHIVADFDDSNPEIQHTVRHGFERIDDGYSRGYLATIDILVIGKTKKQVFKRYRLIRQGRTKARYRSKAIVPQGCEADPEVLKEAEQSRQELEENQQRAVDGYYNKSHQEQAAADNKKVSKGAVAKASSATGEKKASVNKKKVAPELMMIDHQEDFSGGGTLPVKGAEGAVETMANDVMGEKILPNG